VHWSRWWDFWTLTLNCRILLSIYITNKCNQYIICLSFIPFVRLFMRNIQTAVSPHPLKIGHMFIWTYSLRIVYTTTSENIFYSSWNTLYICVYVFQLKRKLSKLRSCFMFMCNLSVGVLPVYIRDRSHTQHVALRSFIAGYKFRSFVWAIVRLKTCSIMLLQRETARRPIWLVVLR